MFLKTGELLRSVCSLCVPMCVSLCVYSVCVLSVFLVCTQCGLSVFLECVLSVFLECTQCVLSVCPEHKNTLFKKDRRTHTHAYTSEQVSTGNSPSPSTVHL